MASRHGEMQFQLEAQVGVLGEIVEDPSLRACRVHLAFDNFTGLVLVAVQRTVHEAAPQNAPQPAVRKLHL